jgi:hypothetical protein
VDIFTSNIAMSLAVRLGDECAVGLRSSSTGASVEYFEFDARQLVNHVARRARKAEAFRHNGTLTC